jgi:hypothetical protein
MRQGRGLFDAGYVTVTPDLNFEVSRRIKEEGLSCGVRHYEILLQSFARRCHGWGEARPDVPSQRKTENHAHAMAPHFMYHNFARIHQTLKTTPAMAVGVTKRLWEIGDIVDVLQAWENRL